MNPSTHDSADPVDDGLADSVGSTDPAPPTDPGAEGSDDSAVSPDDPGTGSLDDGSTSTDEADPAAELPPEIGGQKGPEPTRYGDWEKKGRCTDF